MRQTVAAKTEKTMPMRQVFSGVYVYEMLLFDGEEKYCYIEEQTTGERTEVMCARRTEQAKGALGFFHMLNDMIAAKNTGDMECMAVCADVMKKTALRLRNYLRFSKEKGRKTERAHE